MKLTTPALLAALLLGFTACSRRTPVGAAAGQWSLDIYGPMEQMLNLADALAQKHPEKNLGVTPEDRANLTAFRDAKYILTLGDDGSANLVTSGVPEEPDRNLAGTWEQHGEAVSVQLQSLTLTFRHHAEELVNQEDKSTLRRVAARR